MYLTVSLSGWVVYLCKYFSFIRAFGWLFCYFEPFAAVYYYLHSSLCSIQSCEGLFPVQNKKACNSFSSRAEEEWMVGGPKLELSRAFFNDNAHC